MATCNVIAQIDMPVVVNAYICVPYQWNQPIITSKYLVDATGAYVVDAQGRYVIQRGMTKRPEYPEQGVFTSQFTEQFGNP